MTSLPLVDWKRESNGVCRVLSHDNTLGNNVLLVLWVNTLRKIKIESSEKPPVSLDSSGSHERKRPLHGWSAPLSPSSETSFENYLEGSIELVYKKGTV